jgi:hypothetical protein
MGFLSACKCHQVCELFVECAGVHAIDVEGGDRDTAIRLCLLHLSTFIKHVWRDGFVSSDFLDGVCNLLHVGLEWLLVDLFHVVLENHLFKDVLTVCEAFWLAVAILLF